MPDTAENQAHFPQQANQKPGLGFPIICIARLILLSVGSVISYAMGPYISHIAALFFLLLFFIAPNGALHNLPIFNLHLVRSY